MQQEVLYPTVYHKLRGGVVFIQIYGRRIISLLKISQAGKLLLTRGGSLQLDHGCFQQLPAGVRHNNKNATGILIWNFAAIKCQCSWLTCVCKSTSAAVVAGQQSAMLWNGVMSIPLQEQLIHINNKAFPKELLANLLAKNMCSHSSVRGLASLYACEPLRGAGLVKQYLAKQNVTIMQREMRGGCCSTRLGRQDARRSTALGA